MKTPLEAIKEKAQQKANSENKAIAIYNLNPYSPMYVMRDYSAMNNKDDGLLFLVLPDSAVIVDITLLKHLDNKH